MSKDITQTTLYRLVQTGHMARETLQSPLRDLELQSGDDAILLALKRSNTQSEEALGEITGLPGSALKPRIERLLHLSLVSRRAIGTRLLPGIHLTKKGRQLRKKIVAQWFTLDAALMEELKPKQQRRLKTILDRFVDLLLL